MKNRKAYETAKLVMSHVTQEELIEISSKGSIYPCHVAISDAATD